MEDAIIIPIMAFVAAASILTIFILSVLKMFDKHQTQKYKDKL